MNLVSNLSEVEIYIYFILIEKKAKTHIVYSEYSTNLVGIEKLYIHLVNL